MQIALLEHAKGRNQKSKITPQRYDVKASSSFTTRKMRFRKDLGDLTELKQSIKKHGLIHPVVVDSKGNLIAGERRRAACRELGFEPEVRIVDFDNPQQAEIDENTCRKDFTPREIYEIGQYYNENNSKQGKRSDSNNFGQNQTKVEQPRKIVAKIAGISTDTLSKIKQVYESQCEGIKINLDLGKTSIDAAYRLVKAKEVEEKRRCEWQRHVEQRRKREEKREKRRAEEHAKATEAQKQLNQEYMSKRKPQKDMALKMIDLGYKAMAKRVHPDVGGTSEEMHVIQELKRLLIKYVENNLIYALKN